MRHETRDMGGVPLVSRVSGLVSQLDSGSTRIIGHTADGDAEPAGIRAGRGQDHGAVFWQGPDELSLGDGYTETPLAAAVDLLQRIELDLQIIRGRLGGHQAEIEPGPLGNDDD